MVFEKILEEIKKLKKENPAELQSRLNNLDEKSKQILSFLWHENFSFEEVADFFGMSVKDVEVAFERGIRKLSIRCA